MDYKVVENGRLENNSVRYDIADILSGDNNEAEAWLRANLKPGDTVQWIYPNSNSELYTYEEKVFEWKKWDAYESGKWDGMSKYKVEEN